MELDIVYFIRNFSQIPLQKAKTFFTFALAKRELAP